MSHLLANIGIPGVAIAIAIGFILAMVFVLCVMWHRRGQSIEHFVQPDQYLGRPVVVLLPIHSRQTGKVRLELYGQSLELMAATECDRAFEIGEIVYGVAWEQQMLWVMSHEQLKHS